MNAPCLALTAGEPAGIGPDLLIQLAQTAWPARLVALTNPDLLRERATQLDLPLTLHLGHPPAEAVHVPGSLWVTPIPLSEPVIPGQLSVAHAPHVMTQLATAHDGCLAGHYDAIVTAPVQKSILNDAGIAFSGHTEYFQQRSGVPRVVMMLACPTLRVALATTHLPLRDVADTLTQERLTEVLTILLHDLQHHFGLARPRVLVAGLNPHAGEGGHLGREEIDVIEPVLAAFRAQGADLVGPLPADTLFTPRVLADADAVLAMYHDQGLPVLKHVGFGDAVNITLGLPYLRTSVDHGTALDLAGTGRADVGSLRAAVQQALDLIAARGRS